MKWFLSLELKFLLEFKFWFGCRRQEFKASNKKACRLQQAFKI